MASVNARTLAGQCEGEATPPVTEYCYSRLQKGHIRVVQLMSHPDRDAPIRCQLVEQSLRHPDSRRATCLYEALSYVWGSGNKPLSIFLDKGCLHVTKNLYEALLGLRDRYLPRIIWIDAICINQNDTGEREHQVGMMAEIYARASRVIVWLEEIIVDGDRGGGEVITNCDHALEVISKAATHGRPTEFLHTDREVVATLLRRSWFQRVWVSTKRPIQLAVVINSGCRYCRRLLRLGTS